MGGVRKTATIAADGDGDDGINDAAGDHGVEAAADAALPEAIQDVAAAYTAARSTLEQQRLLWEANIHASPTAEDLLRARDSSIKRNNALLKRLRALSEDTKQAALADIQKVNQSRYVAEAVAAVAEAPIKAKDIPAVVEVCSVLHQQYAEFGKGVVRAFGAALATGAAEGEQSLARRRTLLRLLAQLLLAGVSDEWAVLVQAIKSMVSADFHKGRDDAVAVTTILGALAKAERATLLGFPLREPAMLSAGAQAAEVSKDASSATSMAWQQLQAAQAAYAEEAARRALPPADVQKDMRAAFKQLFSAACAALEREHAALLAKERNNTRTLTARGDLPEHVAEAFEAQKQAVDALQRPLAGLAEQLEAPLPALPESTAQLTSTSGISVIVPKDAEDFSGGVFEDEDTRTFYEVLPDLRFLVPGADGTTAAGSAADAATDESSDANGTSAAEAETQDAEAAEADEDALQDAGAGSFP